MQYLNTIKQGPMYQRHILDHIVNEASSIIIITSKDSLHRPTIRVCCHNFSLKQVINMLVRNLPTKKKNCRYFALKKPKPYLKELNKALD